MSFIRIFSNMTSATRDAIVITLIAMIVFFLAVTIDLYEMVHSYLEQHEKWELDEVLIMLQVAGLAGFVFALRRLTEFKREARLRTVAEDTAQWTTYHDVLTELPNRRFLNKKAPSLMRSRFNRKPYSVFAIDLNGFKKVNELLGHGGGDAFLVIEANRLTELFHDGYVIRLSGDEFLAIAPHVDEANDLKRAREIVSRLSATTKIRKLQIQVGASVGIATVPAHARTLKDAAICADAALCSAKSSGINTAALFHSSMAGALSRRAELEQELRKAVAEQTIIPHYQPLIDLEACELKGFEALARWRANDGRDIPPDVFIEVADELGLISELSEHLLSKACQDAANWPSNIRLSFNITPSMLGDPLLSIRLIKILAKTGVSPRRLEIEITEKAVVQHIELAKKIINDLRSVGIRVVLDDFGTGYSSLAQLADLPFDKFKIDRSFITTFESDEKQRKIVKTMIALGRSLDIETTAEGIEEESQLALLKKMGCCYGQGYLFGKAIPGVQAYDIAHQGEGKIRAQA